MRLSNYGAWSLALALMGSAWAEVWKVEPGIGVGPIRLGKNFSTVPRYLTPADSIATQNGGYLRFAEGVELEVANGSIVQIVLHKQNFTTKAGPIEIQVEGNLKMGMSQPQMASALGGAYESRALPVAKSQPAIMYYAYKAKGLGVRTEGGRIIEFSVWPRH